MASVCINNVQKHYGTYHALKGVSTQMSDGEFVVLVGPSGCGKSTLLRMIAGLEGISEGTIEIGSKVVNNLRPKDRDVALVFQNYALYPHMTEEQNMSYALRLMKTPKNVIEEKIGSAARILNITDLLKRYPRQLSGGQRQRVAMGRAIVRDPQVFLFDEPLSNLDAKLRVQMRAEIKQLHQRLKTTIVYVTHDQIEAMTMAEKIVVMRDGAIEQIGSPLELYDRPRNEFVAGFIGSPSMNFIPGSVRDGLFVANSTTHLPLPAGARVDVATYGIRPEHLKLDDAGFPAEVVVIEPMGFSTQIIAKIADTLITVISSERLVLQPGSTVHLMPHVPAVHLFDRSGLRISD
ncbi:sn-glycerol-3-phosphate ABC transporter ATP-binding protein UgpC [Mesorhizobium sp.]|uniref:ABC transporter ATP-binding protein n=1 Tax=Mesorhizobium sp. TaxID=1871066 RepID=UPI000FE6C281|nr:sn-glycerol-3-phosphate ABC transporter ATP-binding protein UgpC [Mesorhizobium sp.]RWK63392.1 MAG: sn-glycerol-3-phosphate ABC transporter ATP-binding protein UgpC [Mesorhizobium sp.]